MAFFLQLRLLLWKNLLLQRRKICVTVFEIILPLLFAVVLFGIRFIVPTSETPANFHTSSRISKSPLSDYDGHHTIIYYPNNSIAMEIMEYVNTTMNRGSYSFSSENTFMGFATQKAMLDYYHDHPDKVKFGVEFDIDPTATNVKISLRPRQIYSGWHTTETTPFSQAGFANFYNPLEWSYDNSGFLTMQLLIHEAIISRLNQSSSNILQNMETYLHQMPDPPYLTDPMIVALQTALPILLMLSFILMAIQTTKGLIYEKERKLKESMKLMGLTASAHWVSWFIYTFVYVFVVMGIYTIFCGVDASGNGAVLAKSDASLFFVFLLCYGVAMISFCFMISVLFKRANVGAAVSGIVFFLSYCPYFYLQTQYQVLSRSAKLASCLLINLGMAFGAYSFALYEATGIGAKWSNIQEPAVTDDNFSLQDAIMMLLVDTVIHLLITWYVDNVWPGEFGVPKPFYFPFTKVYWCGSKPKSVYETDENEEDSKYFERKPAGLEVGIAIKNLRKVFGSGGKKKIAVDGMDLNMYKGQISVLLGHNGAGKTTTMSMLTGFIPATSGSATVNGFNINTDIQSVRQSLGLCPQHNILFDTLTVWEHLEFFALLKGSKNVQQEVDRMANEVGLGLKKFTQSQHLSGGQKRKLSVGIALIGGSEIVILDEPTSGMDPAARRQTWDILQRNRQGRTMLLTTHFMDEADLLGDRIAIMAEGVVKCCGTSYFLKKLYGAGYHLVMVKQPNCNIRAVTTVVQQHIPTGKLESEVNAELTYLLPDDESPKFAGLFTEIEQRMAELGISSFGTSATTMEEVFLKVENTDESDSNEVTNGNLSVSATNLLMTDGKAKSIQERSVENGNVLGFNEGYKKSTGLFLEMSRFRGMFMKKLLHTWRNRTITIVQLLLPVAFTAIALAISKIDPGKVVEVALTLDLSPFKGSYVPHQDGQNPTDFTRAVAKSYADQLSGTNNVAENIDLAKYGNMSNFFLQRAKDIGRGVYNKKMVIAGEFQSETMLTGHYNGFPYHAQPISLSYLMNSLLKYFTSPAHSVTTINHPLPFNETESSSFTASVGAGLGFAVAFCMIFGMAFLTSSFVYFLIKERQVGAKHLQVVSGVGPFVFWMSNFAWDFINYMLPSLLLLIVFAGFQSPAYSEDGRLGVVFLLLVEYGMAVLPYMYIIQYIFKTPPTGTVVTIVLNIVTGLATLVTTYIMELIPYTKDDAKIVDWVFSVLFPHYNFGKSIMSIYTNYNNLEYCLNQNYTIRCLQPQISNPCCKDSCGTGPFDFCLSFDENFLAFDTPGIGRFLVVLLVQAGFFLLLIMLIEYQVPQMIIYKMKTAESLGFQQQYQEHPDVTTERHRVASMLQNPSTSDPLILNGLYKSYGGTVAVDNLTVGIPNKECFGLLGQNGAGKTTTFKMLTGDVMLTSGNASLYDGRNRYDVKNHIKKVQENMGYCPQFDALIDQMTGRETLAMYARLKGVPERCISDVCKSLLDVLMLRQYADKPTSEYSGGNKRKLSTAIALVGDPAFIMLDEPSTGMDPKARRQLWNVLSQVRECGTTLILTSHSMEECDALCTRIAIMVNGRFMCLGTPQHLKNTFGQGYTLICRMATVQLSPQMPEERAPAPSQPLVQFILARYPNSQVFDDHQGYVHFQVPYTAVSLAQMFTVMEEAKVQFSVEDYSVHQTTLEQVFLAFARAQVPPREEKRGSCCCCC